MKIFKYKTDTQPAEAPCVFGAQTDGGVFSPSVWQGANNRCAIHAQYLILKSFGFQGNEQDLVDEAIRRGWFSEECGTPINHLGRLLESHGVACDYYTNANKHNLMQALASGKRVMVAVDSGELWTSNDPIGRFAERLEDAIEERADHALLVSGIDVSDADHPMVVLTDPGTGQAAVSYPLEEFEDAWEDSGFLMVVTRDPVPIEFNADTMSHFNYATGHISLVPKDAKESCGVSDAVEGVEEIDTDEGLDEGIECDEDDEDLLDVIFDWL